ncbi:hypothetical protein DNC80_07695 [Flavobacterium sp. SOK18b]|uniref:hypothetical protein n=1 Tax=Flavobacterium sp. SOK18b TaxID=797900 RepID=UPI0015FD0677|nr:hypothetical protein [Flavobacterium sp. SOK18b]MBB1193551.1 hypothetical protein [Flavobacterium sp. SOK18b]
MFTKPTGKSLSSAATMAGALVVGAKVGDGVSALMPESVASYKRYIIGLGAVALAACINPKTTLSQAGQNALIGAGVKQLYDEVSDSLAAAIPVKESSTATNRFVNAVVGHTELSLAPTLGSSWQGDSSAMWDRPQELPAMSNSFTGV